MWVWVPLQHSAARNFKFPKVHPDYWPCRISVLGLLRGRLISRIGLQVQKQEEESGSDGLGCLEWYGLLCTQSLVMHTRRAGPNRGGVRLGTALAYLQVVLGLPEQCLSEMMAACPLCQCVFMCDCWWGYPTCSGGTVHFFGH